MSHSPSPKLSHPSRTSALTSRTTRHSTVSKRLLDIHYETRVEMLRILLALHKNPSI